MKIIVNGQTWAGSDKPSPDVQKQLDKIVETLADKNGNGVPDILEQDGKPAVQFCSSSRIVINGRSYTSLEEMPPADRQLFEQMQAGLAKQGWGAVAGLIGARVPATTPLTPADSSGREAANRAPLASALLISEEGDSRWLFNLLLLLVGIFIGLAIAIGVWFALK